MIRRPAAALAALVLALGPAAARADDVVVDPLEQLRAHDDPLVRQVVEAFPAYDAARLWEAVRGLEARRGTDDATDADGWALAQGYLELLLVQRYFERHDADHLPTVLAEHGREELAERGIAAAEAYRAAHPDHSDVERVLGELISFQITGPISGWTKGPEAEAAVNRALEKDAANAWAAFAIARKLFHNPAIAGGDKDASLETFRRLSRHIAHFRLSLYLALNYRAKGMLPQAFFWAKKAAEQAPDNPEAAGLLEELRAELQGGE